MPLEVGNIYKGIMRVEEIKHGGMGTIYICRYLNDSQKEDGRQPPRTVLKTVPAGFYQSSNNALSFKREALIWTILPPHPYLVECISVDHGLDSAPLIWLECAEGGNLRERIASNKLSIATALKLFRQFCVGMHFLFSYAGIIHRDIKPENILLTDEGNVKITDFGLSSLGKYSLDIVFGENADKSASPLHETNKFIGGTLPYMSPEHFGEGEVTVASDIYSFGAVMFEVIQGRLLFNCASAKEFRRAHLTAQPPVLSPDKAPLRLSLIITKCIQKEPSRRFASFAELDDALADVIAQENLKVLEPQRPSVAALEQEINSYGWNRRGYAFGVLSRYNESLRCYEKALDLNSTAIGAYTNMGTALERVGRHDDALTYFERAVEIHKDEPNTLTALAFAYAKRDRWEDGLRQLEIAAQVEPPNISILRHLCEFYLKFANDLEYEKIASRIYQLLATNPEYNGAADWVNEGIHFGLMGEFQTSLRFFNEGTRRFPKNIDALYNQAVTLFYVGDFNGADNSIRDALAIDSNLIQARFLLGILRAISGDRISAVMEWQLVNVLDPHHRLSLLATNLVSLVSMAPPEMMKALLTSSIPISTLYYR